MYLMRFHWMVLPLALNLFSAIPSIQAQNAPKGYPVPEMTLSPDGQYGVTVPMVSEYESLEDPANRIIEISTGRIVAEISAETGWNRMNHGGVEPSRWSSDGSLLLWTVDGKWFPHALVLLKMEKGSVAWQTNILTLAQEALLKRTQEVEPQKYAAAKKANEGNGSAYPEGFSIDVAALDPIALPLRIHAALTSNPKGIEGHVTLESHLDAIIDEEGRFIVKKFARGPGRSTHF